MSTRVRTDLKEKFKPGQVYITQSSLDIFNKRVVVDGKKISIEYTPTSTPPPKRSATSESQVRDDANVLNVSPQISRIEPSTSGSKHTCEVCTKTFTNAVLLAMHRKEHQIQIFKCGVCDKVYVQERQFCLHVMSHEPVEELICQICGEQYTNRNMFEKHIETHTVNSVKPFKCKHCAETFNNIKSRNQHENMHTDNLYDCLKCGKGFSKARLLIDHERTHKRYKCKVCGKSISATYLQRHNKMHLGIKDYKCKHCDASFNNLKSLKNHYSTHTKVYPFNCHKCTSHFYMRTEYEKHLMWHDGFKPFICKRCPQAFLTAGLLKLHENRHDRVLVKCLLCDKEMTKQYLNVHVKLRHSTERPYKCQHCPKAFVTQRHLNQHAQDHSDIFYPCSDCDKLFNSKRRLRIHINHLHRMSQQYKCHRCDKGFKYKSDLLTHLSLETECF